MKEFVEKLIERLEEAYDKNDKTKKMAYEEQDWEKFDLFTHRCEGVYIAIEIAKDFAEEYKECALCYFGSPCEYQNKDVILPPELLAGNNGWISVEECIGCKYMECKHNGKV